MAPPGVAFLARLTLQLFTILGLLGLGIHYAGLWILDIKFSACVSALIGVVAPPLYFAYRVWRTNAHRRHEADAMGARPIPVVQGTKWANRDILQLMIRNRKSGYPGDGFSEYIAQYGAVLNLKVLWEDRIFTVWPDHIKQILASDFGNYVKGERFQFAMGGVLGSGVFNSDGEMWKFHRTLTRPYFSRDRISHFDTFDRHADLVISILQERTRNDYSVDFQDIIGRFTMDSATEFLFGVCVDSLKANIPYAYNVAFPPSQYSTQAETANEFIKAFNDSMQVISERGTLGDIWPLFEIFHDKAAEPMRIVDAYLDPIIRAAVEKKHSINEKTDDDDGTLLDDLLDSTMDPKVLKDETLNILLAGRDTTMHTLTMAIYFLSIYPEVCARLRAEILAHVGPTRRPTYDDIKDMKYLRAVINESMRLYPSVPFNLRESINATTWTSPDPNEKTLYIPAGTKVAYSVFLMHRSKELWGPDAEEFSPERFLDERLKKYLLNNSFQFLPSVYILLQLRISLIPLHLTRFNAGPRICLGQQFAYNEMSFMIIRLLQSFSSIALDEAAFTPETRPPAHWAASAGRKGVEKFRPKLHLTMQTSGGMWVRMKEAVKVGEEAEVCVHLEPSL
ncbi:cytochrome P450 [Mycena crocata]|nr:cytochrome P450 [Mycena crocata]